MGKVYPKGGHALLNAFFRTSILFFVTAIVLRLMGKRQLAQLQPYEVVITLMISDLATLPMGDVEIPLLGGVMAIVTLLILHSLLSVLSFASMKMRSIICGRPSVLVRDGKICEKELSRLCFDLSDLMEGIRSAGLIGLHETGCVVLETNGTLSVFPSSENTPVTRGDQNISSVYEGIPLTLILDGKVQARPMRIGGFDTGWLMRILKAQGIERAEDVLIAALDTQGKLLIQEKGEKGRLMSLKVIDSSEVRW